MTQPRFHRREHSGIDSAGLRAGTAVLAVLLVWHGTTGAAGDVLLRAADAPVVQGAWTTVADATAAGGSRLSNPDFGQPRPPSPLASPPHYVELTFHAEAGVPYRLWLRGKAEGDSYENDSVWLQFSDSVTAAGAPQWRIGTNSATTVMVEDCANCGLSGWGWQDNGFGGPGEPLYFATSGVHTLRIQVREDGLSIDQIVLSPDTYFDTAPGALRDDGTILIGGTPALASLVRGPYLQQVGSHGAIIVWATLEGGAGHADVGGVPVPALTTAFPAWLTGLPFDYFQHEAAVSGLTPASTYGYRLFSGSAPLTDGSDRLTTAPATGTGRVVLVAFGDSGTGSAEQRALSSRMTADTFDLALLTGDLAYGNAGGTGAATYGTYQSWFFDVYGAWLRRRPVFPSMGNHDSRAANDWGRAYLDLFALPTNGAGAYADHAERYYSFDYGPLHVVALDTELAFQDPARRAAQLAWLEADLSAAAAQPWKVALYHRSPFSAGGEHGSDLDVRAALAPIFERHGVQLSLSAHEHDYERTVPWRTGADVTTQAVTYVVTGGGGGPLYPAGMSEWTAASASDHHYLRVTLDGCRATIEAVRAAGELLDGHVLDRCAQAFDAAPPVLTIVSPAPDASVSGTTIVEAYAADDVGVEKVDLWIDGQLYGIDREAPYAFHWDTSLVAPGSHTLTLRAHDANGRRTGQQTSVFVQAGGSAGHGLPAGWQSADVGPVAQPGSASEAGGTVVVSASGADIWGTSDAFHFVFRPLAGDGAITARVSSLIGSEAWTKVGVMVRASTAADAPHGFMFVSLGSGTAFQRRRSAGGPSSHTAGPAGTAPQWVRLTRTGTRLTAAISANGSTWQDVGSDTVGVTGTVLAGLAVTSHSNDVVATGLFDSVTVTTSGALSGDWQARDVGDTGVAGGTSTDGSTFVVTGAGADVWGTSDAFQFAWQTLPGDGEVVARVLRVSGPHPWTKAGVMMRATLDPASSHAFMLISADEGVAFQRRAVFGGTTTHSGTAGTAPGWVRLVRRGNTIAGHWSADGITWMPVGSDTIASAGPVHVGLAVTSHDASQTATATFDQVTVIGGS